MRILPAALLPLAALVALSGCEKAPLYVDQAVVRLSPNAESPSAGYFTVHAGADPVTLRAVTSEAAVRVEMHDSVVKNGLMTMQQIDHVDIPAKGVLRFEPGGRHLMLWQVDPSVAQSGKVTLTLLFSNGDRILVDAAVQKTGEAAPAPASAHSNGMQGHDMMKDHDMANMGNMAH
ncbi:copper chaperone PCu(A)C [Sphingobium sufflavum]|uniref:copper chaperone PCu(A)C n=1 Tax=Sphingobium sufflavum TaxID=1129547 RepID=UPI001F330D70|nr:copper chaperone PCu(A)C [Sphingobium sufflavum]MCE7796773.1 copper chaperone PCu(A)C [Sphingobium sufflavum]